MMKEAYPASETSYNLNKPKTMDDVQNNNFTKKTDRCETLRGSLITESLLLPK
jgi:hypothetical protein